jgi:endoglucanase
MFSTLRRGRAALVATTAALALGQLSLAAPALADAGTATAPPLSAGTGFFTPPPDPGAVQQVVDLGKQHRFGDAALIAKEVATPQAVWFTKGTPQQVTKDVRTTALEAKAFHTVPTMVVYNVPGRDCSQYSSGGAGSDTAYRAWADGFAAGLLPGQQIVVVVEPDGLANLPSDCPAAYPGQDVAALTTGRIADIKYAGEAIEKADPAALVYLDAGHSAWHGAGDTAERLDQAGVREFQGFSLNVSNYQATDQLSHFGTWVSDCLTTVVDGAPWAAGHYDWCPGPYNGPVADYSAANVAAVDASYAGMLAGAQPTARFVLDTSRNGQGPWAPAAGTTYPDPQTWCNPPKRGLGAKPQAQPNAAFPLVDAYLWIKTPGQSDGQCNRGLPGKTDPEWGGITDPAAGAWFPQQALQLAQLASSRG